MTVRPPIHPFSRLNANFPSLALAGVGLSLPRREKYGLLYGTFLEFVRTAATPEGGFAFVFPLRNRSLISLHAFSNLAFKSAHSFS